MESDAFMGTLYIDLGANGFDCKKTTVEMKQGESRVIVGGGKIEVHVDGAPGWAEWTLRAVICVWEVPTHAPDAKRYGKTILPKMTRQVTTKRRTACVTLDVSGPCRPSPGHVAAIQVWYERDPIAPAPVDEKTPMLGDSRI